MGVRELVDDANGVPASEKVKKHWHIDSLLPSKENHAYSVDGSALKPTGQLHVTITLGDVSIDDTLHIFPKIPGGMLIFWRSVQQLKILPKDYPAQIQSMTAKTCPVEVIADDLVHEFPTVFDGQVKTMKGECFKIHFKGGGKAILCHCASNNPICVQRQSSARTSYLGVARYFTTGY